MNRIYKVNEVLAQIDEILQYSNFKNFTIEGEVSNVKYHENGYIYLSLKDNISSINCTIFPDEKYKIGFRLENGNKIKVTASINIYKARGELRFNLKNVEKVDLMGEIYKEIEENKKKYFLKGYFDESIKKPIPYLITKIGVITALTGAAIEDIINTTKSRNPYVDIFIYSVRVQGEGADVEIAKAIDYFNENNDKYDVDALIVGRGGGSMIDLHSFNSPQVIEAIYRSKIFVVSAVGHEIDILLSDYVADLRAATPTQASEKIIKKYADELNILTIYKQRINNALKNKYENLLEGLLTLKNSYIIKNYNKDIERRKEELSRYRIFLKNNLENRLHIEINNINNLLNKFKQINLDETYKNNLKEISELKLKVNKNILDKLNLEKENLYKLNLMISKYSSNEILSLGYSIVKQKDKVVDKLKNLDLKEEIEIIFKDGKVKGVFKDEKK